MNYQEQAEQEMWDAASRHYETRSYRYQVQVPDTGAICMNTDSLEDAKARAQLVGGIVLLEDGREIHIEPAGRPAPDYDPRIDYPERYSDGRPI